VPDDKPDKKGDKEPDGQISGVIQLVKDYARQETLGPLKGWGRYLAFGTAGAFVIGMGLAVVLLGLLRMLQTETDWFDGPNTSILAYLITLAACVVVVGLAIWQIKRRTTLQRKEPS
jgi:predicted cobalt transporter CbtA